MSVALERTAPRSLTAPWLVMAGKEIRENFKWAALGLIAVALLLAYVIADARPHDATSIEVTVYWGNVNRAMAAAAPLIGLLLGLLQTIPERRRDLWAFLMHRPASRSSLFAGKAAAGLGLYAAVMAIPFLGVIAWAATPGNVRGPFVLELTLAGWAAILAGVSFYFAAILTVLRPGRWFGRKLVPIAAAIPLLFVLAVGFPFSFALSATILMVSAGMFATAACNAFETNGDFHNGSLTGRFSLGTILFAGSLGVLLLAVVMGLTFKSMVDSNSGTGDIYRYYGLQPSGEIVEVTNHNGNTVTGVRTPDGRPENRKLDDKTAAEGYYVPEAFSIRPPQTNLNAGFTSPDQIVRLSQITMSPNLWWYYIPSLGQFVGYSKTTGRFDSVIGPNGVRSNSGDAGRFQGAVWTTTGTVNGGTILCTETDAYQIGMTNSPVQRIPLPADIGKIVGVTDLMGNSILDRQAPLPDTMSFNPSDPAVAIEATNSFIFLSHEGKVIGTIPRSFKISDYPTVSVIWPDYVAPKEKRVYIWYQSAKEVQVQGWSATGKNPVTFSMPRIYDTRVDMGSVRVFAPVAGNVILALWNIAENPGNQDWKQQISVLHDDSERTLYIIFVLCCPVLGLLIARRCRMSIRAQAFWALGTFLLGIPGLMTMLALYTWPTLVRCPNCSRKRSVDADLCGYCKAPFSAPGTTGTEIFDNMAAPHAPGSPAGAPGLGGKQEVAA